MSPQPVAVNRKAHFDYFIFDRFEAGLVLAGAEVKSVREGRVNLQDSYVKFLGGEVYVVGMDIPPYSHMDRMVSMDDPARSRKLLLHKSEIDKLAGLISRKGYTCIPLSLYFKNGVAKLEVGIAQAKKQYDKRQALKKRMVQCEMRQALKRKAK
ncbi:MAG: SsrA-binding protein [Omnitrophica bacterium RIFCSPLOWO2_12_FULL_50_11]|nr:MAG: SsrA-binding protein [Omnitrophica bacterium RIFCSPLOWO2_12_FULL_50_11]